MEVNVPSKWGQQDMIKCVYHLHIVCKPFLKTVVRSEVDAVTRIADVYWWGAANDLLEIQVGVSQRLFPLLFR